MQPAAGTRFNNPAYSLTDLLGSGYCRSICGAGAFLLGGDEEDLRRLAEEKIEFWPDWYEARLHEILRSVGRRVCDPTGSPASGASTRSFTETSRPERSPLAGLGFIRVGQDGRAYLIAKSEHYHASLGHGFPGYRLLENARRLRIPNATHNNTRGHITRTAEEELIAAANGIHRGDSSRLGEILSSAAPGVLNRVINLETGSLAVEAGLKMMLARFTESEASAEPPPYAGRIPVFLVMADSTGGPTANYHGTTLTAQMLRGMWPALYRSQSEGGGFLVRPVRINDSEDFRAAVAEYDAGRTKVAGFLHEIILMNHGGVLLDPGYLRRIHALCRDRDIPVLVDEIQSCVWSPEVFLFREYGLRPDFVAVGKGFPGGEYPASRILTTAAMDILRQFDALVTNGQEEIASLSYLVTLAFIRANRDAIRTVGEYYESALRSLAAGHAEKVTKVEGLRHISSMFFRSPETAARFAAVLNEGGIDISAQTYKPECPPAALTKIPLISTPEMVDLLIEKMDGALRNL